jgi:hypothetical protein
VTGLTADEMFAAGHGGSYLLDPVTGKRTLITEPALPAEAPEPTKHTKPAAAQVNPSTPAPGK